MVREFGERREKWKGWAARATRWKLMGRPGGVGRYNSSALRNR